MPWNEKKVACLCAAKSVNIKLTAGEDVKGKEIERVLTGKALQQVCGRSVNQTRRVEMINHINT